MQQYQFPQGFLWGAAASGPQTEGVTNKRHRSIWDSWFAEQPERFYQQVGPQTVCDTYHQYPQDVALMKQTGFNSFRTSIQWIWKPARRTRTRCVFITPIWMR